MGATRPDAKWWKGLPKELRADLLGAARLPKAPSRPADFAKLAGITELQLAKWKPDDLGHLAPLRKLVKLQVMDGRELRTVAPAADHPALARFTIVKCRSDLDLSALPRLSALTLFGLNGGEPAPALEVLPAVEGLEFLMLPGCRVEDAAPLARLRRLKRLDAFGAKFADHSFLAGMAGLEDADLYETGLPDLEPLAGLRKLRRLRVGNCPEITDLAPLAKVTSLESLDIGSTSVRKLGPLAGLKKLRYLLIEGLGIPKEVRLLAKALPRCRIEDAD